VLADQKSLRASVCFDFLHVEAGFDKAFGIILGVSLLVWKLKDPAVLLRSSSSTHKPRNL